MYDGHVASDADDPAMMATEGSGDPIRPPAVRARQLGRYELQGLLGMGGMGEVHRAIDLDLERAVAIKVLHTGAADGASARLLREARAMARLDHPNVVKIFEVDSIDGVDFVVMELVAGSSLAAWLSVPRPPTEVITAFVAAGRGLAAAHAVGMVHRDFKPANVLRSAAGSIKVGDFGLARDAEPPASAPASGRDSPHAFTPGKLGALTQTGALVGTPAYMAPEQWASGTVSAAADQFAFCVALWEALSGERPFRGESVADLRTAIEAGIASVDASHIPSEHRATIVRGLAHDPAQRWPSIELLLRALDQVPPPARTWTLPRALAAVAAIAIVVIVENRQSRHSDSAPADPHVAMPKSPAALLATVEVLGVDHVRMPRATIQQVLLERTELTESVRLVPTKDANGQVIGVRLFAVRPASLAKKLGLTDYDQLGALDELPFDTDEHVVAAYHRALTASQLTLHYTRANQPHALVIDVVP